MSAQANIFFFVGAAVVGVVGVLGLYLVEKFSQEPRRHKMSHSMTQMQQRLLSIQEELEELKRLQVETKKSKVRRRRPRSYVSDDFKTATDLDSSDLEFYDLTSDDETTTISEQPPPLVLLDEKLNGTTENVNEALDRLQDLCIGTPEDPQLHWRIGKAFYKLANATSDIPNKNEYITQGLNACQAALKINSKTGEAHKWAATLIGLRTTHESIKEKIASGFAMKEHLDKAVETIPDDSTVHHMLGRFAYEFAALKWYERKIVSTFFAEPPTMSYEDALGYFIKAEHLNKTDWKENKLYLAKTHIALGQYTDAAEVLAQANLIRNESNDEINDEVDQLLQKYNKF